MKVKGTTLVETLVALVIISITFTIAITIFLSVGQSQNIFNTTNVHQHLIEIATKTKTERLFVDEDIHKRGWVFEKKVHKTNSAGLLKLQIDVRDIASKKIIETHKEFVLSDEN